MAAQEHEHGDRRLMTDAAGDNGERDPDRIESEIRQTREQMSDTLDAIQRRFLPNNLSEQALGYLRSNSGRQFLDNLAATIRDNPIPVTLIGIGLVWLAASHVRHTGGEAARGRRSATAVEGEGSYTAARRYRKAAEDFVHAGRVEPSARAARAAVESEEGPQLAAAEVIGRSHAKGEDPALRSRTAEPMAGKPPPVDETD